jgi:hypothetical protein
MTTKLVKFKKNFITKTMIGWLNDKNLVRYSQQRFFKHTKVSCTKFYLDNLRNKNLYFAIFTIKFDLPKNQNVKIDLLDVAGRLVKNMINQQLEIGEHQITINSNELNGIYLLRCEFDNQQYTNQISFIK